MAPRQGPGLYTRVVSALKIGLPLSAIALLASVFVISQEDTLEGGLVFSKADLDAMGTGLRLSNPRFSGSSIGGDIYDFQAVSVIPHDLSMKVADIDVLSGTIQYNDGRSVSLSATSAELDMERSEMKLNSDIHITTSDGYEAVAQHVYMNLEAGIVTGEGDVSATGPLGTIDAGSFRIEPGETSASNAIGKGSVIRFGNGVRLRYIPAAQ